MAYLIKTKIRHVFIKFWQPFMCWGRRTVSSIPQHPCRSCGTVIEFIAIALKTASASLQATWDPILGWKHAVYRWQGMEWPTRLPQHKLWNSRDLQKVSVQAMMGSKMWHPYRSRPKAYGNPMGKQAQGLQGSSGVRCGVNK